MVTFATVILTIVAILSTCWWFFVTVVGKSAVHEILGSVYLLIVVVCIATLGIMSSLKAMANRLPKPRTPVPPQERTASELAAEKRRAREAAASAGEDAGSAR